MNPRVYAAGAGVAALLGAALIVPAGAQAGTTELNLVHGIPGAGPVDVCIDAANRADGLAEGDRTTLATAFEPGSYAVTVAEDAPENDCATPVAEGMVNVADGQTSLDVVAALDAAGDPTVLTYENDDSMTAFEQGRVTVRHAAATDALDAFLDADQIADGITNGGQGEADADAGSHQLSIFPDGTTETPVVDAETFDLAAGISEFRYVVGTPGDDAQLLAFSDEVGAEEQAEVSGRRLAGKDREATAADISESTYPDGNPVVYLARRDVQNGPDALSGVTLQGGPEEVQGPMLLLASCGYADGSFLTAETEAELERLGSLGANDVVALGGTVAICDDALDAAVAAVQAGQDA